MSADPLMSYAQMMEVLDNLPMLVREKRRRLGLSLRAAAKDIGMSATAVTRLERGDDCSLSTIKAMLAWVSQ